MQRCCPPPPPARAGGQAGGLRAARPLIIIILNHITRRRVKHPNIIGYYDSFMQDGILHIVMEYAAGGSLHSVIKARQPSSSVARFSPPSPGRASAARGAALPPAGGQPATQRGAHLTRGRAMLPGCCRPPRPPARSASRRAPPSSPGRGGVPGAGGGRLAARLCEWERGLAVEKRGHRDLVAAHVSVACGGRWCCGTSRS